MIVTKGLINVAVLTLGALGALVATSSLPNVGNLVLLAIALAVGALWALVVFLVRRRRTRVRLERTAERAPTPGWHARVSSFMGDMWRSFALLWRQGYRRLLVYSTVLMMVYWACRLSFGVLALMAAGWSGEWAPVVVAQLLISSFILPLAPTPGGSGAVELGFAALLTAYAPGSQLLSAVIIYAGLTHYLPTVVGAFLTGRQLWREVDPGD